MKIININLVACCTLLFRRPFNFTPLEKASLYDTATLGFLLLAVRGAFRLPPKGAFLKGEFDLTPEAKTWPLLCHIDQSSGKINVSKNKGTNNIN